MKVTVYQSPLTKRWICDFGGGSAESPSSSSRRQGWRRWEDALAQAVEEADKLRAAEARIARFAAEYED